MSDYASMYSGLPYTYTSNPMYLAYLQQLNEQAMQMQLYNEQLRQQQLQQQTAYQRMPQASEYAVDSYQPQTAVQQPQYVKNPNGCTDGKNDGKISFKEKLKNFGKGVGNFFKGMVCDENGFSWKRTLKTVAVGAVAVGLTVATGGAAAPYLVAAGVAMGTFETGKGIYKAATAKTDEEAKLAYQQIGSGTTAIAGSVIGAKGALKASGAAVPKGNAVTSSLRATWDCMKIAGKGTASGSKAMLLHPIQSASAVKGYYNNTVKPNMIEAFSFKNGHRNFVQAEEAQLNKKIGKIDKQIEALEAKKSTNGISAEKIAKIDSQIADLNAQKGVYQTQLSTSNSRMNFNEIVKQQIEETEAKLADNTISASERARLTSQRDNLSETLARSEKNFKINVGKKAEAREAQISRLKNDIKTATGDAKTALEKELKLLEMNNKTLAAREKIEVAQYNIEKAQARIKALELDLKKTGLTDAQKETINSRIALLEKAINTDKQILKNQNMMIAAKRTLSDVGIAAGSQYLASNASTDNMYREFNLMQEQMYNDYMAQMAQQQQEAMEYAAQQAGIGAPVQPQIQPQIQNYYASNPYGSMMNMPQGNALGFNELYRNPIPDLV